MTNANSRPKLMTISDVAARRLRELAASKSQAGFLRIGLKKGGCAGMEYTMSWVDAPDKFDDLVEDNGAKVLVEPTAVMYLLGTNMDYQQDKLTSGFVFHNPNQKSACGCGESVELSPVSQEKLKDL